MNVANSIKLNPFQLAKTKQADLSILLLASIQELHDFNLSQGTNYPEVSHGFSQLLQTNTGMVQWLDHDHFLLYLFQFIIHYHPIIWRKIHELLEVSLNKLQININCWNFLFWSHRITAWTYWLSFVKLPISPISCKFFSNSKCLPIAIFLFSPIQSITFNLHEIKELSLLPESQETLLNKETDYEMDASGFILSWGRHFYFRHYIQTPIQ